MNESLRHGSSAWKLRNFVQYLVERKLLDSSALSRVIEFRNEIDTRIGCLASLKGYLTPQDILYIITSQVELGGKTRFGDIALQKGLLSPGQLEEILRLQQDPFHLFTECLLLTRTIPEADLRSALQDFAQSFNVGLAMGEPLPEPPEPVRSGPRSPASAEETLRRIRGLSTLPQIVQQILTLLRQPDIRLPEISRILLSDAALSAQVLRLVNSAFFGVRGKVKSINMAVVTLGLNGVRQIVLSSALIDIFQKNRQPRAREIFRHSILSAHWSRFLARRRAVPESEDSYAAGLIHEIGELLMLQHLPAETDESSRLHREGLPLDEAERRAVGMTHADLGAYVCHWWSFPPTLTQAVQYHHAAVPTLAASSNLHPLTLPVHAACVLSSMSHATAATPEWKDLPDEFLTLHGFRRSDLSAWSEQVTQDAELQLAMLESPPHAGSNRT